MKAAVFHQSGCPLSIDNVADPEPGPNDLVIKVCACGICGTDLHWSQVNNEESGWRDLHPGSVMGHEFAGEIVAIGKAAPGHWKIGDRVCAMPQMGCATCTDCLAGRPHRCAQLISRGGRDNPGAYAEYTRVGARETLHLPENISYTEGALVEPLAVGLRAAKRARLKPGDTVLIIGGGPVGLSVALWCKFFGARHIVVSDLVISRSEQASRFGATAAIDASKEDVAERFAQLTGGAPSVVFDAVGVPGSMQIAIDNAPNHGRVVVVGLCMLADHFNPAAAVVKEVDIAFCFCYERADFDMAVDMLAQGRIDAAALVTHSVGFDDFSAAFESLKTPSDQIKVMLEPH